MKPGKIIFLSGVSSSGKSALAIELQKRLTEDFLHLQLDAFIEMLPRTDDLDMFMRMVDGMNRSIAAMTEGQNNLMEAQDGIQVFATYVNPHCLRTPSYPP